MAKRNSSAWSTNLWPVVLGSILTFVLVGVPLWRISVTMKQNRFDDLILKAAAEYGCDPSLVKAVVWRESKFNPSIRGKQGEFGLMQVMAEVGQEWATAKGVKQFDSQELLKPEVNLRIGSWYLAKAFQQWSQSSQPTPIALAQYNAGRSNVLRWVDANSLADEEYFISRIGFPSTRAYVRDILQKYRSYRQRGEF
jgi:soluble lytic murein transglycosylase